jgi:hypothetical protein
MNIFQSTTLPANTIIEPIASESTIIESIALVIINYLPYLFYIMIFILSMIISYQKSIKVFHTKLDNNKMLKALFYLCIIINISTIISTFTQNEITFIISSYIWLVLAIILVAISIKDIFFDKIIMSDQNSMAYYLLPITLFVHLIYIIINLVMVSKYIFYHNIQLIGTIICIILIGIIAFNYNKDIYLWLLIIAFMISILLIIQSQYQQYYQ